MRLHLLQKIAIFCLIGSIAAISLLAPINSSAQTNASSTVESDQKTSAYFSPVYFDSTTYDTPYRISLFSPQNGEDGARAWSQTKSVFVYGVGVVGVLVALPEEHTGWDTDSDIFSKWVENVTEGPEWDRNNWIYNYVGHTYCGGVYYQVVRKSGYRQWDAFIYSLLMSTFYWEYGIEAFAEVPSIQDLVFTPIAGWVYGEWAFQTEMSIRRDDNQVLGSHILGSTALFFLDPIDSLGRGVNRLTGKNLVKSGYGYFSYNPVQVDGSTEHEFYLHMRMPLGASGPSTNKEIVPPRHDPTDPVNTGIIGVSFGSGFAVMDDDWNVEDDIYSKVTLGLYFTPRVSLRFGYAWGELEQTGSGDKIDYENYSLDTQVYLNTKNTFRPYLSAGFGEQVWDLDNDTTTFQWNGGFGAHWKLLNKLSINDEWINYYSPSKKTYDQQVNLGIIYRFGEGEHGRW